MSNGHFSADSPQKSVSSRRIVTVAVICVLVLALAAVGFFLVRPALDPYHCRMADGVSIAGVDVGGMTKGEARKALQAALDETLYRENLTVALPMESITLSPADTGVQVDVRAAVNDALASVHAHQCAHGVRRLHDRTQIGPCAERVGCLRDG